ncbi:MAG: DUF2339 domain-containing protein [Bacteroidia bacterium]|nr:DUF2339 domain-containing protein [Bacteroidia bacterium]
MKTNTSCPNCGNENSLQACSHCGTPLLAALAKLQPLRDEILHVKFSTNHKSRELLSRIERLENELLAYQKPELEEESRQEEISPEIKAPEPKAPEVKESPIEKEKVIPAALTAAVSYSTNPKKSSPKTQAPPVRKQIKKEPVELPIWLQVILAPLLQMIAYVKGVHKHYKEEGRLPVFFLSLGGIVAILFGVAYLMQLGLSYFMDILSPKLLEGIKISFALSGAASLLLLGYRFNKKDKKYKDFASALLGLGIATFYLIFYFLPQNEFFPVFQNPYLSLILVAATAALGIYSSFRFEARVLSVVSYLGASLIPLVLDAQVLGELYLGFLFVLTVAQIYLGRKIDWQPLKLISLIMVVGVIEWMMFLGPDQLSLFSQLFFLHAFSYLFILSTIWKKEGWVKNFHSGNILYLSSSLSILIINSLGLAAQFEKATLIGWIFLANAVLWGAIVAISFQKISDSFKWVCSLVLGAFLTLSIVLLLDKNLLAIGLGVEALLLMSFGFRFALPRVRMEAWLLLGIVAIRSLVGMENLLLEWEAGSWGIAFMHLMVLGLAFGGVFVLYKWADENISNWEKSIGYGLREFLTIWSMGSLIFVLSSYLGIYTYNLALLPMLFMIYWGIKQQLQITEIVGWGLSLSFLLGYFASVNVVGSMHFHEQTLAGKASILELGALLWGLKYFYEKWDPDSMFFPLTDSLRKLFFMILPVAFLPGVARRFPDFLPHAVWLSVAISYGLAKFRNRWELKIETHVLVLLASIMMFLPLQESGVAMGVGILSLIFFGEKAHELKSFKLSPFKLIHQYSFWFLSLVMLLAILRIEWDLVPLVPAILSIYFLFLYDKRKLFAPLRNKGRLLYISYAIGLLFCLINLINILSYEMWDSFHALSLLLTVFLLVIDLGTWHKKHELLGAWKKYASELRIHFFFMQLMIVFSYLSIWTLAASNAFGMGLTISLFIHAILLLFYASKKERSWLQRLAFAMLALGFAKLILFDFRNFDLIYKVGVSILSGILMLTGARMYLKRGKV